MAHKHFQLFRGEICIGADERNQTKTDRTIQYLPSVGDERGEVWTEKDNEVTVVNGEDKAQ